uniref:Uncharacterized protein n=1 Tax=Anopheles albimanus TaxID=7167 RepID=A0A182F932_ANOAL
MTMGTRANPRAPRRGPPHPRRLAAVPTASGWMVDRSMAVVDRPARRSSTARVRPPPRRCTVECHRTSTTWPAGSSSRSFRARYRSASASPVRPKRKNHRLWTNRWCGRWL